MPETQKRYRSTTGLFAQPIDKILQPVTKRALQKKGFAMTRLLTHWPEIVGKDMARFCRPKSIRFYGKKKSEGILTITAHSGFALQLQHEEPQIIQHINQYFGYTAVGRIKLVTG